MAGVIQRGVYPCRFGPVVGRELSGRRNALVLSSVDLHTVSIVAIVAPTSGQEPPKAERAWRRPVTDASGWASIRQVKTVPLGLLDVTSPVGFADDDEFKDIRQRMALYLLAAARVTRLRFDGGEASLPPGSLLTINPGDIGGNAEMRVVLGSCRTDGVANVFVVSDRPRPGSTLAIDLNGPDGPLTVLPHQVRSVDLTSRLLSVDGILDFWSVIAIKGRFLDLIALGGE